MKILKIIYLIAFIVNIIGACKSAAIGDVQYTTVYMVFALFFDRQYDKCKTEENGKL